MHDNAVLSYLENKIEMCTFSLLSFAAKEFLHENNVLISDHHWLKDITSGP